MSNTNGASMLTITAEQAQYEAEQYEQASHVLQVFLNKKTCHRSNIGMSIECQFGKTPANIEVMVKRSNQGRVNTSTIPSHYTWQVVSADEHIVDLDIPNFFNGAFSAY